MASSQSTGSDPFADLFGEEEETTPAHRPARPSGRIANKVAHSPIEHEQEGRPEAAHQSKFQRSGSGAPSPAPARSASSPQTATRQELPAEREETQSSRRERRVQQERVPQEAPPRNPDQVRKIEDGMRTDPSSPSSMYGDELKEIDYNEPNNPLSDRYPPQEGFSGWLFKAFKWDTGASAPELSKRRKERERLESEFVKRQQDYTYFKKINRNKDRTRGYCGFITIESEKGGVGKTTVTSLLSYVLGEVRQDPIVAADLNPDRGSLPRRLGVDPYYSIRDLVNNADQIPMKRHVHEFVDKVPGANISVLGGDTRADRRESTSAQDVITVARIFQPFFSIAVLDNGTGITHSSLEGSHRVSHAISLVIDNTNDAYDFVSSTLAFLESNKYQQLRNRVVLVIVDKVQDPGQHTDSSIVEGVRESSHSKDIMEYFSKYVRDTVIIPFDPVLAKSGPIAFKHLHENTLRAARRLASSLMDDLVE